MQPVVAILEDNPARVQVMRAVLQEVLPEFEFRFYPNAPEMLAWLDEALGRVVFISLDHDLDSVVPREEQAFDPGCGRDVADYLAARPPVCPVIVHTSNNEAAPGMLDVLHESGWRATRVYPRDGINWIRSDWAADLRELLARGWIF